MVGEERRHRRKSGGGGSVLFTGCSFTFGVGVQDHECYPALLATQYGPKWKVSNRARSSWGTGQAYWVIEDAVSAGERPAVIFYGWIADHISRNALRRSWYQKVSAWPGLEVRLPNFDVRDGELIDLGSVILRQATLPDTEETYQREVEVSVSLIKRMAEQASSAGALFVVVLLNMASDRPDPVADRILESGIPVIDCRNVSRSFFDHDSHPKSSWHMEVAQRIADDERLAFLREEQ